LKLTVDFDTGPLSGPLHAETDLGPTGPRD